MNRIDDVKEIIELVGEENFPLDEEACKRLGRQRFGYFSKLCTLIFNDGGRMGDMVVGAAFSNDPERYKKRAAALWHVLSTRGEKE